MIAQQNEYGQISDSRLNSAIRRHFGVTSHAVPIEFCPSSPVGVYGREGGWRTLAGDVIRYPGAYSRKGFSNMQYNTDSRWISIDRQWLGEFIRTNKPYSGGEA